MINRDKNKDQPPLVFTPASETSFRRLAADVAQIWGRTTLPAALVVGLEGPLGAGKTTWVRGMLEGLGHHGRVPSPTYTLLEHYETEARTVVHLDLYRLEGPADGRSADEFEALGVRDWLAGEGTWLLVEWPGRSRQIEARCDIWIDIGFVGTDARRVTLSARSPAGGDLLTGL